MKTSEKVHHAYRAVFNSPHGAMVLEDLKKAHHYNGPTYDCNTRDINQMLMAEGERNVVLRLLAILESNPSDFMMSNLQED